MSKSNRKQHNHLHSDEQQQSAQKENTNRHVYLEDGAKIDFVKSLVDKYDASQATETVHNRKQLLWTIVAAFLVFIYTAITGVQTWLTRQSINNNSKQFEIDQRPYLWTTNTIPTISLVPNEQMWANIQIVNFGKAPALSARVTGAILVGPSALRLADQWFTEVDNRMDSPEMTEMVIPPGLPTLFPGRSPEKSSTEDMNMIKPNPNIPTGGFGGGGFFSVFSQQSLRRDEVDYIMKNAGAAVMVAHLRYYDASGNTYTTNICLYRNPNGTVPSCSRHNEIN